VVELASVLPDVGEVITDLVGVLPVTVKAMVAVLVVEPLVPVTVMVEVPAVAVEAAVKVTVLEVAELVGLKTAVTPVGKPEAVKATLPEKVPESVTEMASVAVEPTATERVVGAAAIV
jgi:hypothetical protein